MTERFWLTTTEIEEVVRPLLQRLADADSPHDGEYEDCKLCGEQLPWGQTTLEGHYTYDYRGHAADCPWRQARELLGIPLNRIKPSERERLGSAVPADWTEWRFVKAPEVFR